MIRLSFPERSVLENGTEGVSVKFDDEIVCGVSEDNFDETFQKYVLDKI